jgi:molybdenum cofactor biosynthesis enzyme MoaA
MIQERLTLPHGLVALLECTDEDRGAAPIPPVHNVTRCPCESCQRARLRPHGVHCPCAQCKVS